MQNQITRGMLGHHLTMSSARMECAHYRPSHIWSADKNGWAGDWEGRAILALVSLAKATGREPAYLDEIMDLIPEKLNARGYIGPIEDNLFNEQQFAGNSWFLRGLIEYTNYTQSDRFVPVIESMVRNLYLPAAPYIDEYPLEKYEFVGTYSGSIVAKHAHWMLSNDIGCLFISIDGLSHAYELLRWPELYDMLQKMIGHYFKSDLLRQTLQTHATLSALRGVLRLCRVQNDCAFLPQAESRFAVYTQYGMTENYENCTKFFDPKWTEPCGVVDSYMCCIELFRLTKDPKYIDLSHRILYNGIFRIHLPNGGFVLDSTSGFSPVETLETRVTNAGGPLEAYWCCTMRGADGISYVAMNQAYTENNTVYLLGYHRATLQCGSLRITEKTAFPDVGCIQLSVQAPKNCDQTLALFVPSYAENVRLNGAPAVASNSFLFVPITETNTELCLTFDFAPQFADPIKEDLRSNYRKVQYGCLVLATETADPVPPFALSDLEPIAPAIYRLRGSDTVLRPLYDMIDCNYEAVPAIKRRILFNK